jgi:integrase
VRSYELILEKLARWAQADPSTLNEEDVRRFFVYLKVERHYAPQTMRQARGALVMFFNEMLGRAWGVFATVKTKDVRKLPVVISRAEVVRLIDLVEQPRFRVCLRLIYECGLRLNEALRVTVRDIDKCGPRLIVRQGKGGKDRVVPLSKNMYEELRWWWVQHRNPEWLFPALGLGWRATSSPHAQQQSALQAAALGRSRQPMSDSSLQQIFAKAVVASGLVKRVTIHTLRHSYATHLLEQGVHISLISRYLGHASLDQTIVYLHLTEVSEARTQEALSTLSSSFSSCAVRPCGKG